VASASSIIFQTFACHDLEGDLSYLKADYSISCATSAYSSYRTYAWFMALAFPVGIPLAYAVLLYRKLDIISPDVSDPKVKNSRRESRGDDARMSRTTLRTTSTTHERQLAREALEALEAKAKGVKNLKFLYKDTAQKPGTGKCLKQCDALS